jgi:hypothetical protein
MDVDEQGRQSQSTGELRTLAPASPRCRDADRDPGPAVSFETFYVETWAWAVRVATLITQSSDAGQEIAQRSGPTTATIQGSGSP